MNLDWLPARIWNEDIVGKRLSKIRSFPGARTTIRMLPKGTLISFDDSTGWAHPWQTTPFWVPGTGTKPGQWMATVKPGFVNGIAPSISLPLPGTGVKTFSILDSPRIPLITFRSPGGSGDTVPAFFQSLGVGSGTGATGINVNSITGNLSVASTLASDSAQSATPSGLVLLAIDLWLSVARATYSLATTVSGNLVTGQLVDYTVTYNTASLAQQGGSPWLKVSAQMPSLAPLTLDERLMGVTGDDGEDRKLISTVYLMSPPNPSSQIPDGSWLSFVRHGTFWNQCHAAKNSMPINLESNLLDPSLAFFLGQYSVAPAATLGAMNAESQLILASVLNSTSNEGRFWNI